MNLSMCAHVPAWRRLSEKGVNVLLWRYWL